MQDTRPSYILTAIRNKIAVEQTSDAEVEPLTFALQMTLMKLYVKCSICQ